jgi:hypothetical protein
MDLLLLVNLLPIIISLTIAIIGLYLLFKLTKALITYLEVKTVYYRSKMDNEKHLP